MTQLYLDTIVPGIGNLGPGRRIVMWVQGCTLACTGCMSPELWQRREENRLEVSAVLARVASLAPGHDGLTISGGEPFQQAEALTELLQGVRRATNLDVLVYSGFTLEELRRGSPAVKAMLGLIDVLIDGRFAEGAGDHRIWRGSDNQVMHLLSAGARSRYAQFAEAIDPGPRTVYLRAEGTGNLRLIGIPRRGLVAQLSERLLQRGLTLKERDHS